MDKLSHSLQNPKELQEAQSSSKIPARKRHQMFTPSPKYSPDTRTIDPEQGSKGSKGEPFSKKPRTEVTSQAETSQSRPKEIQWVIDNASECEKHQRELSRGFVSESGREILKKETYAIVGWAKKWAKEANESIPKELNDDWHKAYNKYKEYEAKEGSKSDSSAIIRIIQLQSAAVRIAEYALSKTAKSDWHENVQQIVDRIKNLADKEQRLQGHRQRLQEYEHEAETLQRHLEDGNKAHEGGSREVNVSQLAEQYKAYRRNIQAIGPLIERDCLQFPSASLKTLKQEHDVASQNFDRSKNLPKSEQLIWLSIMLTKSREIHEQYSKLVASPIDRAGAARDIINARIAKYLEENAESVLKVMIELSKKKDAIISKVKPEELLKHFKAMYEGTEQFFTAIHDLRACNLPLADLKPWTNTERVYGTRFLNDVKAIGQAIVGEDETGERSRTLNTVVDTRHSLHEASRSIQDTFEEAVKSGDITKVVQLCDKMSRDKDQFLAALDKLTTDVFPQEVRSHFDSVKSHEGDKFSQEVRELESWLGIERDSYGRIDLRQCVKRDEEMLAPLSEEQAKKHRFNNFARYRSIITAHLAYLDRNTEELKASASKLKPRTQRFIDNNKELRATMQALDDDTDNQRKLLEFSDFYERHDEEIKEIKEIKQYLELMRITRKKLDLTRKVWQQKFPDNRHILLDHFSLSSQERRETNSIRRGIEDDLLNDIRASVKKYGDCLDTLSLGEAKSTCDAMNFSKEERRKMDQLLNKLLDV